MKHPNSKWARVQAQKAHMKKRASVLMTRYGFDEEATMHPHWLQVQLGHRSLHDDRDTDEAGYAEKAQFKADRRSPA